MRPQAAGRLVRLCDHSKWSEHPLLDGKWISQLRLMNLEPEERPLLSMCPGGQLLAPPYPPALVERIAGALLRWDEDGKVHPLEDDHYAEGALFVLDALNGETE